MCMIISGFGGKKCEQRLPPIPRPRPSRPPRPGTGPNGPPTRGRTPQPQRPGSSPRPTPQGPGAAKTESSKEIYLCSMDDYNFK